MTSLLARPFGLLAASIVLASAVVSSNLPPLSMPVKQMSSFAGSEDRPVQVNVVHQAGVDVLSRLAVQRLVILGAVVKADD